MEGFNGVSSIAIALKSNIFRRKEAKGVLFSVSLEIPDVFVVVEG